MGQLVLATIDNLIFLPDALGMAVKAKVLKIGNSLGVILPEEALEILKVKEGEELYFTKNMEGSVQVTPQEEDFERMMSIAKRGMQKYHDALTELAK